MEEKELISHLGKNDMIYDCPFCKENHILNLDKTVIKSRKETLDEVEEWFDMKDREDNDYFECSIGEIKKFLKDLREK